MQKWVHIVWANAVFAFCSICGIALLPILLLSHWFQEKFFATVYRMCQRAWAPSVAPVRSALLARLDDMVSHDSSLRSRGSVRVLEVGAVYGANLEFIRRPVEYWKVEPNMAFEATFQKKLAENPKVKMERSIRGYGEDMHMLPDGHFDAVLVTLVLCSGKDSRRLLSECKRVLTKGGHLLFCEHVGHPKGSLARCVQDFLAAFISSITCDCYINRDSGEVVKAAGFDGLEMDDIVLDVPFLFSRNITGVATA